MRNNKLTYFLLIALSFLILESCSLKRKGKKKQDLKTEKASNETKDELLDDTDDLLADLDDQKTNTMEAVQDVRVETNSLASNMLQNYNPDLNSGETGTYTVKDKNETLMLISFKIYGDYTKWRQIAKANPSLNTNYQLYVGQKIQYKAPTKPFSWNPMGTPYLIKKGDTLGKISNHAYGTPLNWKMIWHNNKDMIRDPNLIFAGFTLYYPENSDGMSGL